MSVLFLSCSQEWNNHFHERYMGASKNPNFVAILRLLTRNSSLHITHMLRRNFLLAPCLAWNFEFLEAPI